MIKLEFNQDEIDELARKLNELNSELSDKEKVLLLSVFSGAAERVSGEVTIREADLVELSNQLIDSFTPDSGGQFIVPCRILPPPPPDPPHHHSSA